MGNKTVFQLIGLDKKSPYLDKTYEDLKDTDPTAFNRLNNAVMRSFVIQQLDPADNSSIYIFSSGSIQAGLIWLDKRFGTALMRGLSMTSCSL